MHDGRLFADAADDDLGVDDLNDFVEVGILARVVADNGILDPTDETIVYQRLDQRRLSQRSCLR